MSSLSISDDFSDDFELSKSTVKEKTAEEQKKQETAPSKKSNSFSSSFDDFETAESTATKVSTAKKDKSSEKIELSFESTIREETKENTTKTVEEKPQKSFPQQEKPKVEEKEKEKESSVLKESKEPKKEQNTSHIKEDKPKIVEIKPTEEELNYNPPKIRPMAPPSKPVPKEDPQDEINRLKDLVMQQRHIIDSQKETIKLLMKEQINYEEMSKLRAALVSKDPLLQLVAATPLSESRAMADLRAENASLRREIDEIETRHLSEMKALRAQYAQFSSRQMPSDGCAVCRRRIRELESQLKTKE